MDELIMDFRSGVDPILAKDEVQHINLHLLQPTNQLNQHHINYGMEEVWDKVYL